MKTIDGYKDFLTALDEAGFSMGSGNSEGIFSLYTYFSPRIQDHNGDEETDPWRWRIRCLSTPPSYAYGKVFLKKSGWIAKKWYPYFYRIRRQNRSFDDFYEEGHYSQVCQQVYQYIEANPHCPLHFIKSALSFDKEGGKEIDRAIVELQMGMMITISGETYKLSKKGEAYGWPVTTFATVEEFWGPELMKVSEQLGYDQAIGAIVEQIRHLNPDATEKKMMKFIGVR